MLIDPISSEIRYIGKTKYSLTDRLCKHLITYERNHRANWIRSLTNKGLKPIIELIEEVPDDEWILWEKYWIVQFKCWGFNLVNATQGGESGIISDKCRIASIKSNKGRKQSKEYINKRISHIMKIVIQMDKNGNFIKEYCSASEAARQINGNLSHITECCNSINKRKTHKGFKWKYK